MRLQLLFLFQSSANTFLTTHQLAPPVDSQQQPFTRQQISASGTAAARLPAKAGTVVSAPARRDTSFSKRTSNHGESKCASAKPTKDSGTRRKKFHRLDFSFYTDKFGAVDVVTYHPDLLKKYFNEEEKPQSSLDAECMFSRSKSLGRLCPTGIWLITMLWRSSVVKLQCYEKTDAYKLINYPLTHILRHLCFVPWLGKPVTKLWVNLREELFFYEKANKIIKRRKWLFSYRC